MAVHECDVGDNSWATMQRNILIEIHTQPTAYEEDGNNKKDHLLLASIPSSHGATVSFSFADFSIVSGRGNECRTIAP